MSDKIKRWKRAGDGNGITKSNPLRMAEPVHRKVPVGASSGASIREFELSPLQMVKEICVFYVKKCSGKYEDNKAAARYVHQMADEIITQLAGVAGEIKRNKGEPELYQALLDEWNENFPPSLGAMGSPKSIAALVSSQSTEIGDLRSALEIERSKRQSEVSEITRSMDAQLQAYKSSVMSERRHQQLIEMQQRENYELSIEEMRLKFEEDLEKMANKQIKDTKKQNSTYEIRMQEAENKVLELQNEVDRMKKSHQMEIEVITRSRDKKLKKIEEKYNKLKSKYIETVAAFNNEYELEV